MEPTKTEKIVSLARQVNARRGKSQHVETVPKYGADMKRSDLVWMGLAFLGIVSLPMFGWIGGLQTLAGALLMWVFYLIQNRDLAWQSSAEHFMEVMALRDELAACKAKLGPDAAEKRGAFVSAALKPS